MEVLACESQHGSPRMEVPAIEKIALVQFDMCGRLGARERFGCLGHFLLESYENHFNS